MIKYINLLIIPTVLLCFIIYLYFINNNKIDNNINNIDEIIDKNIKKKYYWC